jgi:hypothetical protein
MTTKGAYATGRAFRQALEMRLKRMAAEAGEDIQRLRRQVAFDRLLARVFAGGGRAWTLKGGYAMELWLREARATRDVDLTLRSLAGVAVTDETVSTRLRAELLVLVRTTLGDWFEFEVAPATLDIDAAPYGGARFPIVARMDGRIFVKFHLDIGIGDVVLDPVEIATGKDWLGFAGIEPPRFRILSKEQQFAEKLHAYTMPDRPAPNSRVKDLVDLALLVQRLPLDPEILRRALDQTFSRRRSHPLPTDLAEPAATWEKPFAALAAETRLGLTMAEAFAVVRSFYLGVRRTDGQVTPR